MNHIKTGLKTAIAAGAVFCLTPLPTLAALAPNLEGLPPQVVAAWQAPTTTPVVASEVPSQAGLTIPSLWWVADQFGAGLIDRWLAYPSANQGAGRVDLRVRPQLWNRYSYLDRYAFVNHMGLVASDFGYNMLVFDVRQNVVAAYTCDFGSAVADNIGLGLTGTYQPETNAPPRCQVWLNPNFSTRPF